MRITLAAMNQGGTGLEVYADHLYRYLDQAGADVDLVDDRGQELHLLGRPIGGYVTRILSNLYGHIPGDLVHATDLLTLHKHADVVTLHDTYLYDHPDHYGLGGAWWRWWTRRASNCKAVIVNSHYTERCVIHHLDLDPDTVHVTHLAPRDGIGPINILHDYRNNRTDHHVVLFVGSIKTTKNTLNMVHALELLAQRNDYTIHLYHAGPPLTTQDPYHVEILDTVNRSDHLAWLDLGFVPLDQLEGLYNIADCLGFASMDEGFGIPPLEALACGTPVVASHHEVFDETLNHIVPRASWNNLSTLAGAFWDALNDPPPPDKLIAHAGSFTWERTVDQTLQAYRSVTP